MHCYGLGIVKSLLENNIKIDNLLAQSAGSLCSFVYFHNIDVDYITNKYMLPMIEEYESQPIFEKYFNIKKTYVRNRKIFNQVLSNIVEQNGFSPKASYSYLRDIGSKAINEVTTITGLKLETGFRSYKEFLASSDRSSNIPFIGPWSLSWDGGLAHNERSIQEADKLWKKRLSFTNMTKFTPRLTEIVSINPQRARALYKAGYERTNKYLESF